MTTIELLRHAQAPSRSDWEGADDALRPLTERGRRHSREIAAGLAAGPPITAIRSSPLLRCVQTCEPLAALTGLPVEEDPRVAEAVGVPVTDGGNPWVVASWLGGRALALVDDIVTEQDGRRVVVCSHGDVIPALLALLAGRDGVDVGDVRLRKGEWVTLHFVDGRCSSIHRNALPRG